MLRKLASLVLLGFLGTAFIVGAIPFYKARRVQAGIAEATAHLSANHPEWALQALRGVEPWAYGNSSLAFELNVNMIRALSRLARDPAAEERAEWLYKTPALTAGRAKFLSAPPRGLWAALTIHPEALCERIVAHQSDVPLPFQWDRWAGYRVLRGELESTGRGGIAENLARKLTAIDADNPFADLLTRAPARPTPKPAAPTTAHGASQPPPVAAPGGTDSSQPPSSEEVAAIARALAELVRRDEALEQDPKDAASLAARQELIRKLRASRATILAELTTLRRERQPRDPDNAPETRTFQAALKKRNDYYAEMKKHMDIVKRGGANADRSYDALRKMKYQQADVDRTYDTAKQAYQTWQREGAADAPDSTRISALEEQLAAIDRELNGSGNGADL